jgi:hypothetical protein
MSASVSTDNLNPPRDEEASVTNMNAIEMQIFANAIMYIRTLG